MKTLNLISFGFVLLAILFTSACVQHDKKTTTTNNVEDKKIVDKPSMDIHTAVLHGKLDVVKEHINTGTDLNQKEPMGGSTPLISAVTFNKLEIAKALIDANADLSIKNNDGSTALHTAAFFCRIEIVRMLIDAKADKTIRNNFGATPRETVMGDFAEIKPFYEMITEQLKPMGFVLDMDEVKKARPVVAIMLQ